MKTIDIEEIPKYINEVVRSKSDMNLMFISAPGVGKTTVINRWAEENGYFLKTLILSQLDPAEALGVPVVSEREFNGKTYKTTVPAIPEWVFELAEQPKAVLYLDEILGAQPDVMNSFLNLLSEHKVGDIDLSHVIFVSSTNIEGKYIFDPDENFITRFCFFYVKNLSYGKYMKKLGSKIANDYQDNYDFSHEIFEARQLNPRAQEKLIPISNDMLGDFYQGFTNMKLINYHQLEFINSLLIGAVDENGNIESNDVISVAGAIHAKYPRSNIDNIRDGFTGDVSTQSINDIVDQISLIRNTNV